MKEINFNLEIAKLLTDNIKWNIIREIFNKYGGYNSIKESYRSYESAHDDIASILTGIEQDRGMFFLKEVIYDFLHERYLSLGKLEMLNLLNTFQILLNKSGYQIRYDEDAYGKVSFLVSDGMTPIPAQVEIPKEIFMKIGDFDFTNIKIKYKGSEIKDLTKQEFEVFHLFLEHPKDLIPYDKILQRLHTYEKVNQNNILKIISSLRKKLYKQIRLRLFKNESRLGYYLDYELKNSVKIR